MSVFLLDQVFNLFHFFQIPQTSTVRGGYFHHLEDLEFPPLEGLELPACLAFQDLMGLSIVLYLPSSFSMFSSSSLF